MTHGFKSSPVVTRHEKNPVLTKDQVPYHASLVFNAGKVAKFLREGDQTRKLDSASKEIMKEVLGMIALWILQAIDL